MIVDLHVVISNDSLVKIRADRVEDFSRTLQGATLSDDL